jgi:hypothetical protein
LRQDPQCQVPGCVFQAGADVDAFIAHPGQYSDPGKAWSAEFNGRCVAALANDPRIIEKSGWALDLAEVAIEYGLADSDGRVPELRP